MREASLHSLPFQVRVHDGLDHNPNITVLGDVVFGGPSVEPTADRRMYFDVKTLEELLEVARASVTGRAVVHHAGIRLRRVQDGAHALDALYIVGDRPAAERFDLFKGGK